MSLMPTSGTSSVLSRPLPTYTELLQKSWNTIKGQMGLVAGLSLIYMMGTIGLGSFHLIGWALSSVLSVGYTACLYQLHRGETFDFEDFFWGIKNFTRFSHVILMNILVTVIAVVSFICLIIPFCYVSVPLMLTSTLMVMEDLDSIDSLKRSFELTKGHWWYLAGFSGVLLMLNIAGALCLLIGLFVTVPLSCLMLIAVIEKLARSAQRQNFDLRTGSTDSSSIPVNPR